MVLTTASSLQPPSLSIKERSAFRITYEGSVLRQKIQTQSSLVHLFSFAIIFHYRIHWEWLNVKTELWDSFFMWFAYTIVLEGRR